VSLFGAAAGRLTGPLPAAFEGGGMSFGLLKDTVPLFDMLQSVAALLWGVLLSVIASDFANLFGFGSGIGIFF